MSNHVWQTTSNEETDSNTHNRWWIDCDMRRGRDQSHLADHTLVGHLAPECPDDSDSPNDGRARVVGRFLADAVLLVA